MSPPIPRESPIDAMPTRVFFNEVPKLYSAMETPVFDQSSATIKSFSINTVKYLVHHLTG